MTRPNPLTDELTDEAKAELAAVFAEMRAQDPCHVRDGAWPDHDCTD